MTGYRPEPPGSRDEGAGSGQSPEGSSWFTRSRPELPPAGSGGSARPLPAWVPPPAPDAGDARQPSAEPPAPGPTGDDDAIHAARQRRRDREKHQAQEHDRATAPRRESPGGAPAELPPARPRSHRAPRPTRAARTPLALPSGSGSGSGSGSPGFRPFARLARLVAGRDPKGARATAARRLAQVCVDYPRSGRQGARRWIPSARQALGAVLLGGFGLTALLGVAYAATGIPTNLNSFAVQQDNIYYWADGTEMARTGQVDRQAVPLSQIPEQVQWAILAAENETFYTDWGVSPQGMARAVYEMAKGEDVQGGSTITQQYVKNAYLNQQQTLSRKVSEIFIAVKLDNKLSKQQILDNYLNTSWFGRGTYGIERAAKAYYGKDVSQLNASQGAFLASLLKGAGYYDPSISAANRRRAVTRWNWILDRMVAIGKLTPQQRAAYRTFPEPIDPPRPPGLAGQVGYLEETAKAYVLAHSDISAEALDLGGYQIYTTFEKPKVNALAASVKHTLDTLRPAARAADQHVRVGAATVDTGGRIVALYGGPDYVKQGFNDSNTTTIQAGTAFTPFVYAAALSDGVQRQRGGARTPVTALTPYDGNDKVPLTTPEGPYWDRNGRIVKTANDYGRSYGMISLHRALALSVNGPFLQLGMDVGLDRVRVAAERAGLLPSSMGEQVPAFSLGDSTPSAIRMADAYGTFAAGGTHTEPYSVLRVTHYGSRVDVRTPAAARAFGRPVADEVDSALTDAVRGGSAQAAAVPGVRVAGHGGTAQDDKAAWFAGYGGRLSTAVVVFRLDPKSQEPLPLTGMGGTPASAVGGPWPLDIWTRYMTSALR